MKALSGKGRAALVTGARRGIGLGIAAGAAVAAVSAKMMNGKKSAKARSKEMRRSTAKAVHTVGQLIDGVEHMLK